LICVILQLCHTRTMLAPSNTCTMLYLRHVRVLVCKGKEWAAKHVNRHTPTNKGCGMQVLAGTICYPQGLGYQQEIAMSYAHSRVTSVKGKHIACSMQHVKHIPSRATQRRGIQIADAMWCVPGLSQGMTHAVRAVYVVCGGPCSKYDRCCVYRCSRV